MKKNLFFALLCFISINVLGQIQTSTSQDCSIFTDYTKTGFKKRKKVKANTPIILRGSFPNIANYYEIEYKNEIYYIDSNNIDSNGLDTYHKKIENKLKRDEFIKDSIQAVKEKIEREEMVKRKAVFDSINAIRKVLLDSLEYDLFLRKGALLHVVEQKVDSMVKNGCPIKIRYCNVGNPNSAGGVDLGIRFKNISKNTIKYISITGYVINAVKDRVHCTIRNYSSTTVRGVGPIESEENAVYEWENLWYNRTIDWFVPTQIKIEYMNGKVSIMNQTKIKASIDAPDYDELVKKIINDYDAKHDKEVKRIKDLI